VADSFELSNGRASIAATYALSAGPIRKPNNNFSIAYIRLATHSRSIQWGQRPNSATRCRASSQPNRAKQGRCTQRSYDGVRSDSIAAGLVQQNRPKADACTACIQYFGTGEHGPVLALI
jgi:hypothetical protein